MPATAVNARFLWDFPYQGVIAKHGPSLVEGEGVLNDPLGLTIDDDSSEGERRWITIGANAEGELLVAIWTERDDGERLISVRRPTAKERKKYEG
jgi:uncharacterized protein